MMPSGAACLFGVSKNSFTQTVFANLKGLHPFPVSSPTRPSLTQVLSNTSHTFTFETRAKHLNVISVRFELVFPGVRSECVIILCSEAWPQCSY